MDQLELNDGRSCVEISQSEVLLTNRVCTYMEWLARGRVGLGTCTVRCDAPCSVIRGRLRCLMQLALSTRLAVGGDDDSSGDEHLVGCLRIDQAGAANH